MIAEFIDIIERGAKIENFSGFLAWLSQNPTIFNVIFFLIIVGFFGAFYAIIRGTFNFK
jgi:hypothetical protein